MKLILLKNKQVTPAGGIKDSLPVILNNRIEASGGTWK
jgi:hypothetical protein